jgi:hypothetical protein
MVVETVLWIECVRLARTLAGAPDSYATQPINATLTAASSTTLVVRVVVIRCVWMLSA